MHILPRKGDGWFDKLLHCLRESADGTSHGYLVKEMERKHQEITETVKGEEASKRIAAWEELGKHDEV